MGLKSVDMMYKYRTRNNTNLDETNDILLRIQLYVACNSITHMLHYPDTQWLVEITDVVLWNFLANPLSCLMRREITTLWAYVALQIVRPQMCSVGERFGDLASQRNFAHARRQSVEMIAIWSLPLSCVIVGLGCLVT